MTHTNYFHETRSWSTTLRKKFL